MALALNFKDIHSDAYRIYRLMQTSGDWLTIYQDKIEKTGAYPSALIFPEQFLSLSQSEVFGCSPHRHPDSSDARLSLHWKAYRIVDFSLATEPNKELRSLDEILSAEARQKVVDEIYVRSPSLRNYIAYSKAYFFSSKKDARKFLMKVNEEQINRFFA